ncbi:MAG: universal stress protein [Treponema sp.]|jgi:nucleotide-binding universal stress UspA family protein|nr:universal stress protein [Treponema sp.]
MKQLFSNIVIVVTGTDASILAAKYAIVMTKLYHCKLSAVYVVDTATIRQLTLSKIFLQEEGAEYEKSLEVNGNRYLTFVDELANSKGVKIERIMRRGAIYTEVLSAADEKDADLILLGGWERDTKTRDIIGHSHREIMANAKCSVMLVKEPSIDQIFKKA